MVKYSRGRAREAQWFQIMLNGGETVGTCEIVIGECLSGAQPVERRGWREIFGALRLWSVTPEDAIQAGIWRYDFARRGIQLSMTDTIIAAVALRVGATVVTDNLKDFPMPELAVMSLPPATP